MSHHTINNPPYECHIKLLACFAFLNMRLNLSIIEKYHDTLAGNLSFVLEHDLPHTGHFSKYSYSFWYKIQSLGQAYIFSKSILIERMTFMASYVRSKNSLSSGSISFKSLSKAVKLLSLHPFSAFKLHNFNAVDNLVNVVQPSYKGFFLNYFLSSWISVGNP